MTLDERIAYEGTRVMARNHLTSALAWFTQATDRKNRSSMAAAMEELALANECMSRLADMMPDEAVEE